MSTIALFCSLLLITPDSLQNDEPYTLYKDNITFYTLSGYNSTNIALKPNFNDLGKINYTFNPPLLLGLGFAYKGIDLGITRRIGVHLLNTNKFGKSDYFDFKLRFPIKRIHFAIRLQIYEKFSLRNQQYAPEITEEKNLYLSDFSAFSVNIDARFFFKKEFNYRAALGFSGHYNTDFVTPYIYSYIGGSGISHKSEQQGLLPAYAAVPNIDVSRSDLMSCAEMGALPGIAIVKKHQQWQGLLLLGWGPLLQSKSYQTDNKNRSFFGFTTRADLQISIGYHTEHWFAQVMSEFQFRRMNFTQITVQQYYYDLRLYFGYLLRVKKHPKIILKLEERGIL
jgi:hypothetical protein